MPVEVVSGEWRTATMMTDYRIEQLSDMLVERATWADAAPSLARVDKCIAAPGFIWFRFWILDGGHLVEKYFDPQGESLGISVPVITDFSRAGGRVSALSLGLELWLADDGQVIVLGEPTFDADVATGVVTPDQADAGERTIRQLTLAVAQGEFPPAIIRNFGLNLR